MPEINKPLLRLAVAIRAEIASHLSPDRLIQLPSGSWDSCVELTRQARRAQLRGWHLAENELLRDLRYSIPSVQSELASILRDLPDVPENDTPTTTGDIYLDLLALEKELDQVEYDLRCRWLSVTTEPITLQDIYLGPFEIRLNWDRASNASDAAYRVIAKDPHPAESRDNVTHPHVMGEHLCEGDSRHAIRQARTQGRLLDFFTLVANGLRSYNPESPFVELALWRGGTCFDCGALVDDDERYVCQKCDETVCGSCECVCSGCDDSCCSQCITGCAVCDDNYCRGCLHSCKECRASVCLNCLPKTDVESERTIGKYLAQPVLHYRIGTLVDRAIFRDFQNSRIKTVSVHEERCINCHEKESRQEVNGDCPPASDGSAVQPDRVGQAVVSA